MESRKWPTKPSDGDLDSTKSLNLADDLLRGADEIAAFTGTKRRQVYHLAQTSRLPVFKIGSILCARKSRIIAWIEEQEAKAIEGSQ